MIEPPADKEINEDETKLQLFYLLDYLLPRERETVERVKENIKGQPVLFKSKQQKTVLCLLFSK
mgnify:CR=1 FL=1